MTEAAMTPRIRAALLAALLIALPASAQQWTSIQLITDADGAQQLILRDADGSDPRRIAVSSLVGNPVTDATVAGTTLTLTFADGTTATRTLPSGGGGGTDDQTAAEVTVDATGFTGNLSATDTDVQTALATFDVATLGGGGGGGTGTGEQRVESVTFADIANITSTAMTLTLAATTPVAVEFGDGAASMLSGTAGETTFTIADSGVYIFGFEAIYPADGDRTTPFVEVQQDSDDAVIGRSTNAYLRNSGSPEDGLVVVLDGFVSVPSDAIVVKLVLGNSYNQNSMDADGGKFSLVRIGTGLRGAGGPAGVPEPRARSCRSRWCRVSGPAGADGAAGPAGPLAQQVQTGLERPSTFKAACRDLHHRRRPHPLRRCV